MSNKLPLTWHLLFCLLLAACLPQQHKFAANVTLTLLGQRVTKSFEADLLTDGKFLAKQVAKYAKEFFTGKCSPLLVAHRRDSVPCCLDSKASLLPNGVMLL